MWWERTDKEYFINITVIFIMRTSEILPGFNVSRRCVHGCVCARVCVCGCVGGGGRGGERESVCVHTLWLLILSVETCLLENVSLNFGLAPTLELMGNKNFSMD